MDGYSDYTYKYINYIKGHKREITSLDTKLQYLASGSRDGNIIIWKLDKPKPTIHKILKGHKDVVQDVVLRDDGEYVFSASWDHTVKIWSVETGECIKTIEGHNSEVMSIAYKISGTQYMLISVSRNGIIMIADINENQPIKDQELNPYFFQSHHKSWITCCKVNTPMNNVSDNFLSTSDQEGTIHNWSQHFINQTKKKNGARYTKQLFQNKPPINKHLDNWGVINAMQFSPDFSFLAVGTENGILKLCSPEMIEILFSFETNSPINHITFNPTKYWCISANDNDITIWNLESKQVLTTIVMDDIDLDDNENENENENEDNEKINKFIENQDWRDKNYYKTILNNRVDNKIEKPLTRSMCIAWEGSGQKFFVGCDDGSIREYELKNPFSFL